MATGSPELSPRSVANHTGHWPRQPKRGADHVDITGRDCERILTEIGWRAAMRFHVARRFHVALVGTASRSVAQLAGARTAARRMECIGPPHGGTAAAPGVGTGRLIIRLRARGAAHPV